MLQRLLQNQLRALEKLQLWLYYLSLIFPVAGILAFQVSYNVTVNRYRRPTSVITLALSATVLATSLITVCQDGGLAYCLPKARERDCKRFLCRGDRLYASGAYHGSLSFYQQAVNACPSNWEAHLKYGRALARVACHDEGLRELFQSILLNANQPERNLEARAEIAAILMKQGNYDEAGGQLKQILDLTPNDWLVRGNYGICLMHLCFIDQAIDEFKRILRVNACDSVALYNLATAYLRKGDYQSACETFEQTIAIDKRHVLSYLGMASAMMLKGDSARAVKYALHATSLAPDNHLGFLTLGDAYEKLGDHMRALAAYKRAVQINPRDRASRAALEKILQSSRHLAGQGRLETTQ